LRFIYNVHAGHGWPGLAYHFVIGKDGTVAQTNSFADITWHDAINNDSIGILLVGYFHSPKNEKPTKEQLKSLKELLDQLCTQHPEFPADHDDVVGHRERSSTACPGDNLIGYVKDYRHKKGVVKWGKAVKSEKTEYEVPRHVNDKASYFDRLVSWFHENGKLPTSRSEDYDDEKIKNAVLSLVAEEAVETSKAVQQMRDYKDQLKDCERAKTREISEKNSLSKALSKCTDDLLKQDKKAEPPAQQDKPNPTVIALDYEVKTSWVAGMAKFLDELVLTVAKPKK
jgi:hypothetical protein